MAEAESNYEKSTVEMVIIDSDGEYTYTIPEDGNNNLTASTEDPPSEEKNTSNSNAKPKPITLRRRSERLSLKEIARNNNVVNTTTAKRSTNILLPKSSIICMQKPILSKTKEDSPSEEKDTSNSNAKPKPITLRRRSERLSLKEIARNNNVVNTTTAKRSTNILLPKSSIICMQKPILSKTKGRNVLKRPHRENEYAKIRKWNVESVIDTSTDVQLNKSKDKQPNSGLHVENEENEWPALKQRKIQSRGNSNGRSVQIHVRPRSNDTPVCDENSKCSAGLIESPWKTRDILTNEVFKYFTNIESTDGINMKARCTLCDEHCPTNIKSFKKGNSSNLKTHLKRVHSTKYAMLFSDCEAKREQIKNDCQQATERKMDIQSSILKFFIKERIPLSKMNSEHFNALIHASLGKKQKPDEVIRPYLTSRMGRSRISILASEQREKLKEKFKNIQFFSATSDMWSRSNRSFIAVSVHYIDSLTENVKTEFIACESFEGHQTNDRVAEKLSKIFDSFGILDKVFFITTDGAGNYVAALKYYGDNYESIQHFANDEDLAWLNSGDRNDNYRNNNFSNFDSDSEDDCDSMYQMVRENSTDEDEATIATTATTLEPIRVHDLFATDLDSDLESDLNVIETPYRKLLANTNHIACSSHLLDKVGSKDALKANQNEAYKTMYDQVFEKLETIWKQKDSRLTAEVFTKITGRKLIGPHRIRWLKTFDAVKNILSISQEKLDRACTSLCIPSFDANEYMFLMEYHKALTPIAVALKTLEANKYTFGLYLPVLLGLRTKLNELKSSTIKICLPLIYALENGFEERFKNVMDVFHYKSRPLYIAMASNPKFKLNFLGMKCVPPRIFQEIRKMLFNAGVKIMENERKHSISQQETSNFANAAEHSVITDDPETETMTLSSSLTSDVLLQCSLLVENDVSSSIGSSWDIDAAVEQEVQNYLASKTTSDIELGLKSFPIIQKIYKKYNCIRSTEAICERLFSYAGMILNDKRGKLTAQFFEDLLILHMNEWL